MSLLSIDLTKLWGKEAVAPEAPVIPDTFPTMPTPRRNVCWALREMRDRFQSRSVIWIKQTLHIQGVSVDGFCLVGLAQEVTQGEPRLFSATLFQLSRAIESRGPVPTSVSRLDDASSTVMHWNDRIARDVDDVCSLLAKAEFMAERSGACEP